jgi:hypothetical protein
MDLGFETIGNATLIFHDRAPVLATDPWIVGSAYFGSWGLSHAIPPQQREAIERCRLVWISHGHPDHLSAESLERLRGKTILLPDAVGGRICRDLRAQGFAVRVLPDRVWTEVSPRIRVLCIGDVNQDGILLADVGGRLVVDLNDASDRGWGPFVKRTIARARVSFLLRLSGFGDADMINLRHEDGSRLERVQRIEVGREIAGLTHEYGARYFIPFSSMHRYQRADSDWANRHVTHLEDYPVGFASQRAELLPAFVRFDCVRDCMERIDPPEQPRVVREPSEFGDRWDEPLEPDEAARAERYFRSITHLDRAFDFIRLRVGGREHVVVHGRRRTGRGITFEAPRRSLVGAIDAEVFDDLLIGNFMKTTLHGGAARTGLYPDFTPYVAKYADNGRAKDEPELARYFATYLRRAPLQFLRYRLEEKSKDLFRSAVPFGSGPYRWARRGYRALKERLA